MHSFCRQVAPWQLSLGYHDDGHEAYALVAAAALLAAGTRGAAPPAGPVTELAGMLRILLGRPGDGTDG